MNDLSRIQVVITMIVSNASTGHLSGTTDDLKGLLESAGLEERERRVSVIGCQQEERSSSTRAHLDPCTCIQSLGQQLPYLLIHKTTQERKTKHSPEH